MKREFRLKIGSSLEEVGIGHLKPEEVIFRLTTFVDVLGIPLPEKPSEFHSKEEEYNACVAILEAYFPKTGEIYQPLEGYERLTVSRQADLLRMLALSLREAQRLNVERPQASLAFPRGDPKGVFSTLLAGKWQILEDMLEPGMVLINK